MSVSKAVSGAGTQFFIGTPVTTPVYSPVAELKTFSVSGSKNDTEDITNADSTGRAKEYLITLLEAGTMAIAGNYIASDVGQGMFRGAFASGVTTPFKMILPLQNGQTTTGETWTFLGIVEENDINISYSTALSFSAKIKITGIITVVAGT